MNKNALFFTISGLRGIVGEGLTPFLLIKISLVFGSYVKKGKVVIGKDTRKSGEMCRYAVISGLLSSSQEVVDLGTVPTPTVLFNVRELKAQAGIAITASHNPPEWNALKFISSEGTFFKEKEIQEIKTLFEKSHFHLAHSSEIKELKRIQGIKKHIYGILKNPLIALEKIREKNFKVVIDTANGAGNFAFPSFLETLNAKVIKVHCDKPGIFERELEPKGDNLQDAQKAVIESNADIGFATDADGDRLVIILKDGKTLSEECTLPLCLYYLLKKRKSPVVVNYSTSCMVERVAEKFGVPVKRTKVGEAWVVEKMIEENSFFGGEGNGGVIVREINFTRDALVGIGIILSLLSETGDSREFSSLLPNLFMIKEKIPVKGWNREILLQEFPYNGKVDLNDGIRFAFENGFLHIRVSNTEPVTRIIAEGEDKEFVLSVVEKVKKLLNK